MESAVVCRRLGQPRELVARIRAVLRRSEGAESRAAQPRRSHGRLELDLDRFEVSWDGQAVVLTVTEFAILEALSGYPGKVFSRDELIERCYRDSVVSDRTIDSHVRRLRRKFAAVGGEPVETVHGLGYRLGSCA